MATTNAYSKREVYKGDITGGISIDISVDYSIVYYLSYTTRWLDQTSHILYISSKTKPALQALY
jgi:hypothetical protein